MIASVLLLFKFLIDIVRRLINDKYYRALGMVLLLVLLAGTLFYWMTQGRTFIEALGFSAATMAMNSPYGIGWGPSSNFGVVFHIIYMFISVGIFILFVLETGKTMVKTYDDFNKSLEEKKERKAKKLANSKK